MARSKPPNIDPERIDVALSLVGAEGNAAIKALADAVQKLNSHLAGGGASGASSRFVDMGGQTGREASGTSSNAQDVPDTKNDAGKNASTPSKARGLVEKHFEREAIKEEEQARRRKGGLPPTYESPALEGGTDLELEIYGGSGGDPSNSASMPSEGAQNESVYRRYLRSNPTKWERAQEAPRIPQFGELTLQNQLEIASGFFQRSGEKRYQAQLQNYNNLQSIIESDNATPEQIKQFQSLQANIESTGKGQFGLASGLRQASEAVGYGYAIKGMLGTGADFFGNMERIGAQGGYDRNMIGFGQFGITSPISGAAKEGFHQKINAMRLGLAPFISGAEAQMAIQGLAESGYFGDENQNLAFDVLRPIMQSGVSA